MAWGGSFRGSFLNPGWAPFVVDINVSSPGAIRLATLRLVIEPLERIKSNPTVSRDQPRPAVNGAGSVASESQASPSAATTASTNTAKATVTVPAERKSGDSSKCFDDLLSLSLGDDVPGAKERLRKAKCQ
jgi:hypothetical protein